MKTGANLQVYYTIFGSLLQTFFMIFLVGIFAEHLIKAGFGFSFSSFRLFLCEYGCEIFNGDCAATERDSFYFTFIFLHYIRPPCQPLH